MNFAPLQRRSLVWTLFIVSAVFILTTGSFADAPKMDLKAGDEVYVCNCGPGCDCMTMSKKPGNCTCNKPMVQAKVDHMEGTLAVMKIPEGDSFRLQPFNTQGKYFCACGSGCDCNTISQKPGKCVCGNEMKAVN